MKITRKAFKQSGDALEQAVRRDMNGAIAVELDRAIFLGTGANRRHLRDRITDVGAAVRATVVRFMSGNPAMRRAHPTRSAP
jgi:hypothetical protein